MAFRKHLSGQKGFTLIELLVVVAILGILAGIAVPRIIGAIDAARARKADADLVTIRDSLERFYLDYGVFPITLKELQGKNYLDPNFNFKNSYGFFYFYAVRLEGDYSTVAMPTVVLDTEDFKDYVLADPGQVPPDETVALTAANPEYISGDNAPQGLDPTVVLGTDNAAFWTLSTPAGAAPAGLMRITIKDISGTATEMQAELRALGVPAADPDPAHWVKYKGK